MGYTWKSDQVSEHIVRETALVDVRFIGSIIGKQGAMIKLRKHHGA